MRITLSDHFTYQKLLRFTMPSIVMMIITSVYSIVDGFFVSNCVGKNAFAALNLIFPVLMALSAFGFMVGTGGSALIAKTLGEGKTKEANGIFSMLVAILAVGGAVLAAVFFVFIRPISYAVGATELTIDDCVLYGRILLVSLPLFMRQNSFQSFLATAEKPGFGLKVTVFAGLTNVVLDFLLVYVLPFGLAGAALATALSQAVGAAIPLAYFLRENDTPLRLGRPCFDLRALWRACCNGSSEMVSNLSGSLVGILYNIQLMAIARENGVSAYGVLMYVDFIFKAFFFGYSIAVTPVVGYHYGAKPCGAQKPPAQEPDHHRAREPRHDRRFRDPCRPYRRPLCGLRRGAARYDGQRPAHLLGLVSCLRLQHLRLGVLHRVERRHGQRAHFVPADAGVSGRGDLAAAEVAGHQRHLARRHRRGIAHAARHRFAPCREAEKISLLSRKIPAARREFSRNL